MSDQPLKHGAQHTPLAPDGIRYATWHIVLSGEATLDLALATGILLRPPISEDMDSYLLRRVMISAAVASSSGSVQLKITNETTSAVLATGITLASGSRYSNQSGTIDLDELKFVTEGDILKIECTSAGTGVKGLKLICVFW